MAKSTERKGRAAPEDPFDLNRFVRAQEGHYHQALEEIRTGRKRTHWMWFIFPQIQGLGVSATAQRYAIRSLDEAAAYLRHPILGPRIVECAEVLLSLKGSTANDVFGSPDDLKLRSSVTLFARISPPGSAFERVLSKYYRGNPDSLTLEALRSMPSRRMS